MKIINWTLLFLCFIALSSFFFYNPMPLFDLVTGARTIDFSIKWPVIRIITEPFYAFSFYALTMNRDFYRPAVISWASWTLAAAFLYCMLSGKSLFQTAVKLFYSLIILVTLFVFVALVPLPGPSLVKPEGYAAFDAHSHTVSSHDNISTARSNLKFHLSQGFDSFFITEHNNTVSFMNFPESAKFKTVFPGMQIQTKDKISVLILSDKEFNAADYKDLRLEDLIKKAHRDDKLVIMPHWWKWHKFSFKQLADMGIDGFEIYNCGYRNFDPQEQKNMIAFAVKEKLLMVGSTDWHGWGYMTDVWTVFPKDEETSLYRQLAAKPRTSVIVYRQEQDGSLPRFIFEPFAAFYYYVQNADLYAVLSFMIWIAIIGVVAANTVLSRLCGRLSFALAAVFAVLLIYFTLLALAYGDLNKIIKSSVIPVSAVLCALWFAYAPINKLAIKFSKK
ncbi:MAG: hypothetical protein LBQ47_01550 [Endomicrobium sp.]|jgi:hypothetical protein|nr:hypothetical protein [Endomicrobium sp.]